MGMVINFETKENKMKKVTEFVKRHKITIVYVVGVAAAGYLGYKFGSEGKISVPNNSFTYTWDFGDMSEAKQLEWARQLGNYCDNFLEASKVLDELVIKDNPELAKELASKIYGEK